MRVLIACEFSGIVRNAFAALGHEVTSCDFLPTETDFVGRSNHYQGDVRALLDQGCWDLMIAHPPCTHLAVSGARWFKEKAPEQAEALRFVVRLLEADIPKIALENPVSIISTKIRKPDQVIQPWQFGHAETKMTCFWLKNLPPLKPTAVIRPPHPKFWTMDQRAKWNRVHRESPGPERWKNRSRTLPGIAAAMAAQWAM